MKKNGKAVLLLGKCLLASYIVTGILLLLLAMFLFHLYPDDGVAAVGIVVIYCFGCLLGGFLAGKQFRKRKWLWGLVVGLIYFGCISAVSFFENQTGGGLRLTAIRTLVLCAGCSCIGGMLA